MGGQESVAAVKTDKRSGSGQNYKADSDFDSLFTPPASLKWNIINYTILQLINIENIWNFSALLKC